MNSSLPVRIFPEKFGKPALSTVAVESRICHNMEWSHESITVNMLIDSCNIGVGHVGVVIPHAHGTAIAPKCGCIILHAYC